MLTTLQLLAILLLITAGILLGRRLSRLPNHLWLAGFLLPFALITLIILGHRSVTLSFTPPISWAIHPHLAPLLMALAIPFMLATLIFRLPLQRTRITVSLLLAAMVINYSLLPIVLPLLVQKSLAATPTHLDPKTHICLQTHPYTCGPAAAVTCLNLLHIHAEEGPLAIDAHCAPALGTDPTLLAAAINHLTAPQKIHCDYRLLKSLDRLTTPAIANIFSPQYGGHYVAVLQITPTHLLIADPLAGLDQWPREEFLTQWTGAAHIFTHDQ